MEKQEMNNTYFSRVKRIGYVTLLAGASALAQEHQWAGRSLDNFEWAIHERLSALPSHGVFDSIDFEVRGSTVVLSGYVLKDGVKHKAERAVRHMSGVQSVVNHIEVLPSSSRDEALRGNVYRAVYEKDRAETTGAEPAVHIIVKNGWVTLEGVANSEDERNAIHLRALKATSNVIDHLRVTEAGV
jgi:hyperosmotically inducible periplasmic protein